jgi:hypothetical protein
MFALSMGIVIGAEEAVLQKGLDNCHNIPQRRKEIRISGFKIIDDTYNASPESMTSAISFMKELKESGVKITGGSSLKHADLIYTLKENALSENGGKTVGGCMRAPLSSDSPYGGFYFYAQHLVEMVCEVFGRYPKSVKAYKNGQKKTVVFRYDDYDVTGLFTDGMWEYHAIRYAEKDSQGGNVDLANAFDREFDEFYKLVNGGEQAISYDDFISPVFIMNAIERSLLSGNEETVKEFKV